MSSLGPGGAERAALQVAAGLAASGREVEVLTLRSDVPDFHAVPDGVRRRRADSAAAVDRSWWDAPAQLQRSLALRREVLAGRPAAVLAFTDLTNVAVLQALALTRVPVVVSEQIDPRSFPLGARWEALRRLWYPTAARVVLQTAEVAAWAAVERPRWKVTVAANPVTPPVLAPEAARPEWFAARNVVAMGRLAPQKGFDLLLPVFARLADRHPDWSLTVLGEGPDRPALERQVHELGLLGRVHLRGLVNPPWDVLAAGDVFAFSSRFEGFPNALMEAMACGLPTVSFACPTGPAEIVRDGVDGLLVPAGDLAAFESSLDALMTDGERRRAMAREAVTVVDRFGTAQVLPQWADALDAAGQAAAGPPVQTPRCPLCRTTAGVALDHAAAAEVFRALREQWGAPLTADVERDHSPTPTYRLLRCCACGLEHFDPPVPGSPAFYAQLADGTYYPERWEFDVVGSRLGRHDVVLDLGAGNGAFLASLRGRVAGVVGVDHSPAALRQLRDQGIEAYADDFTRVAAAHAGRFSVVTAFQTVEHVADVAELLEPALKALAPGGRLFLSAPNRERWGRGPLEPLDWPPHHLSRWSPQQWQRLADRFDLRVVQVTLQQPDFSVAAAATAGAVARPLARVLPAGAAELAGRAVRRVVLTQPRYARAAAAGRWVAHGVAGHTMLAELARRRP